MERILRGYQKFHSEVFTKQRQFFEHLSEKQQRPVALFITCSDSRIDPNLVTQTEPGDLFILRNAGNIIPPYGSAMGGEGATIEYAIAELGIKNLIICGHSRCGAMRALLSGVQDRPAVSQWFTHAEATRRIAVERYGHLQGEPLFEAITEENVLIQLNNLSTHPFVTSRMARGELKLFGWYYQMQTGKILQYNQSQGTFEPLTTAEAPTPACPLSIREIPANGTAGSQRVAQS